MRYSKLEGEWHVTTLRPDHNHPQMSDVVLAYTNRNKDLTMEMREFISSLVDGNVPTTDILTCYHLKFPKGPPLTQQDIANQNKAMHGGSQDAYHLLELLQQQASKDPDWFFR